MKLQPNPQQAMREAIRHHQAGRFAEAEALYRRVLRDNPKNADALNLLGSIANQVGRHEAAADLIHRAIRINGRVAGYHSNLGHAYHALGKFDEAIASYERSIAIDPSLAHVHYNLGLSHSRAGHFDDAICCYRKAIELDPGIAFAHGNLGHALAQRGEIAEAVEAYRTAIEIRPDYVEAHYNLGNALRRLGRLDEAVASFREAIKARPDYTDAHFNLGNAYKELGRYGEAEACFKRVLEIRPDDAEAYSGLGDVYTHTDKLEEAVDCCRKALAIDPAYADAPFYLGNAFVALAKWQAAVACFQKAIELKPDFVAAYNNLGNAFTLLGKADEAADAFRKALEIEPDAVGTQSNLGLALISQGKPRECRAYFEHLKEIDPGTLDSTRLFVMNYMADYTPEEILAEHRRFAEIHEAPLRSRWPKHRNSSDPERRLRIGYVSPDFKSHSVAYFIEPILQHHDRGQFEIYGYHNWPHGDAFTDRIAAVCDHWLPCAGFSDDALADRIQADGIDILVDLAGHTQYNRMLTFARKPAPVQVTYLGYASTTGLSAIDYRLTTPDVDPAGNEAWHSERLFRLPRTLWCYRAPAPVSPAGAAPGGRKGSITFGCTNNFSKVSPESIALWGELLRNVPGSRLLMTSVPEGSARTLLRESFAAHGVEGGRLSLHGKVPREQFIALSREIDIALDPFPYNGTTSTCEILWLGVPVITLIGRTSVARSGYALLKTVGLSELCAGDAAEYLRIAADLARDLPRLDAMRESLRSRIEASPLRDEAGLARDIEQAYRTMWREWCSNANGA
jgi:protein O-GlcNAc transferase